MKRGRKVTSGPCAALLPLPTAADLYARFMTCRYNPEDQEEAFKEVLETAGRFRLTHELVRGMISDRRASLQRELDELSVMFPVA